MLKYIITSVLLLFFFLISCNRLVDVSSTTNIIHDSPSSFEIKLSKFVTNYTIIPLETTAESLIGKIDELIVFNEKILVLDKHVTRSLLQFDLDGNFVRRIGKLGKGKGEFIQPIALTIDYNRELIAVLCCNTRKLIFFNDSGIFNSEIKLPTISGLNDVAIVGDKIYIDKLPLGTTKDEYLLYQLNHKGLVEQKFISNNIYRNGFRRFYSFNSTFSCMKNHAVFYKPLMNTIFKIEKSGVDEAYNIKTEEAYSKDEIKQINAMSIKKFSETIRNLSSQKFLGVSYYIENTELTYIEYQCQLYTRRVLIPQKTENAVVFKTFVDDITNIPQVNFISSYKNSFVRILSNKSLELLINNIQSGNYNQIYPDIKRITLNNNPVLIVYECENNHLNN